MLLCLFRVPQKCLTTLDLTSLGVGSCCGTGMYLVAGMVARNIAGPGVVLSFFIAAVASIFSGESCLLMMPHDNQARVTKCSLFISHRRLLC